METLKTLVAAAALAIAALLANLVHAQVTADDFLPPVNGGPADVANPGAVKVEKGVVSAPTAQDAINAAVDKNEKALDKGAAPEMGATMVTFPSGMGFVATGIGAYRKMANPVATRIAKRKAYVVAFVQAKKNLAEMLGGLSNEGQETIREHLVNINLPDEEMTNISTQSEEALTQAVNMMLRGFVIYEVKDEPDQDMVTVSIVTTPKTRGKFARPAPNVVEANDLREGLNQVIAEVTSGIVPPVGGRIVSMRATGETAFVGFGSTVVRTSENRAVQARHNLSAQKIASMRAKDALCGLIIGDRASWMGNVTESMKDEVREFESLDRDDPLARKDPTNVRKFEQARETWVARMETTDTYRSARKGILPPGVNTKTWFDDGHEYGYAMSVYAPSLTDKAAQAGREMREGQILQPAKDKASGFTDKEDADIKRPGDKVKEGPTGKVSDDSDL